jgi:hypothetical protein
MTTYAVKVQGNIEKSTMQILVRTFVSAVATPTTKFNNYRENHMRVDAGTWEDVFKRDKGYCQYCGDDLLSSFSRFHSATVDHLVAVSVGGNDKPENLVLACPSCNSMLSRAGELRTHAERKVLVMARIEERQAWYLPLLSELRQRA